MTIDCGQGKVSLPAMNNSDRAYNHLKASFFQLSIKLR